MKKSGLLTKGMCREKREVKESLKKKKLGKMMAYGSKNPTCNASTADGSGKKRIGEGGREVLQSN